MATEKRLSDMEDALRRMENAEHLMHNINGIKAVDIGAMRQFFGMLKPVDAVELPCKIGDKVYRIDKGNFYSDWKPFIQELTVTEISWKKEKYGDKDLGFAIIADGIRYKFTSIGKSVFLTRKEAESKMDGERKDND